MEKISQLERSPGTAGAGAAPKTPAAAASAPDLLLSLSFLKPSIRNLFKQVCQSLFIVLWLNSPLLSSLNKEALHSKSLLVLQSNTLTFHSSAVIEECFLSLNSSCRISAAGPYITGNNPGSPCLSIWHAGWFEVVRLLCSPGCNSFCKASWISTEHAHRLAVQPFRKAHFRALREQVRLYCMGDQDSREMVEEKESSMPASPWCWMLEMVAPCLPLKTLLTLLGTITDLAPRCLIWVCCGIIIPCQSFWGIVRRSHCFEAGKDMPPSPRIWPVLFLLSSRAIFKHHKSVGKTVLVLSLQGPLLPSLPPGHCWLLCSGSPSGAMFTCFSLSGSHSSPLSSFLYPIIIWSLPDFFPFPREGNRVDSGNGDAI